MDATDASWDGTGDHGPELRERPAFSWPAALLPGMALTALLMGGAATQSAADDRPAGRSVVELEVTGR
jgi:hypothetical protein